MTNAGVSIVVLTRNGARHLDRLLSTFFATNTHRPFEIIVVDHGSKDDTAEVVGLHATRGFIRLIRRGRNYSFAASNNLGASRARFPLLLFLNNDIVFSSDLLPLAVERLADPSIGVVGVRLEDDPAAVPHGKVPGVQHAGIMFAWDAARGSYWPVELRPKAPEASNRLGGAVFPAVTGAFLLCRKADFDALSGFNEEYQYGLEDVDLCLRFGLVLEKRCWCINEIGLQHTRGATQMLQSSEERAARLARNHRLFQARWGEIIRAELPRWVGCSHPARDGDGPCFDQSLILGASARTDEGPLLAPPQPIAAQPAEGNKGPAPGRKSAQAQVRVEPRTPLPPPPERGASSILVFSHNLHGDEGAPTSLFELSQGLRMAYGHHLYVVSPTDGDLRARYEGAGIQVVVWPALESPMSSRARKSGGHFGNAMRVFGELFSRLSVGRVLANTALGFHAVHAAKARGIPATWIVRESEAPEQHFGDLLRAELRPIFRAALNDADHLVFVSEATRETWSSAIEREAGSVRVIPNGLVLQRFADGLGDSRRDVRALLGLRDDELLLLNVGTICKRKNQHVLLEAIRHLPDSLVSRLRIYCVGASSRRGYSEKFFEELESDECLRRCVVYVLPTPDIGRYYLAADAFVLTSLFESYPRVVLEALYFSLPILASPVFGVQEQTKDEDCAVFFDPADAVSLARGIAAIAEEGMRAKMSAAARRQFERLPDFDSMVRAYHELLVEPPRSGCTGHGGGTLREPSPADGTRSAPVSVVIPNFNYSRYLGERIASIVRQTVRPREIIFLDDASTDDSVVVAESALAKTGIPFRIIENSETLGPYRQWRRGIREARDELVWIAEADDSSHPEFLATMLELMADPEVVLAYSQSERVGEGGEVTSAANLHHTDDISKTRWLQDFKETGIREVVDALVYRNTIPNVSACLFRRAPLAAAAGCLEGFRFCGDWLLYGHLLKAGSVAFVARSLNRFRRHPASVTRRNIRSIDFLEEVLAVREFLVREFPIHRRQIPRIAELTDKDYKIEGIPRNSDSEPFRRLLASVEELVAGRRRIAIMTTNEGALTGGSEVLWREAALRLRAHGHDVVVAMKRREPAPAFASSLRQSGIAIYARGEGELEAISRFEADLVVISTGDQDEGIEYFEELRRRGLRYVTVIHLTKQPEYWPVRAEKVAPVLAGCRGAEKVFFTSWNNHRVMENRLGAPISNAAVFFNPLDVERDIALPFPSMSEGLQVAMPSRLLKIHKGQHLAIEVLAHEKWRSRRITLNLYGDGPDKQELQELAESHKLPNVIFHPRMADMADIWRRNHAILMTSFMEGMPLVLIGAMLARRVPIVTDVGGHREVIEDDVTGFIAALPTIKCVDEAMERAYQRREEWEEIGALARRAVLDFLPEDPLGDFVGRVLALTNEPRVDLQWADHMEEECLPKASNMKC